MRLLIDFQCFTTVLRLFCDCFATVLRLNRVCLMNRGGGWFIVDLVSSLPIHYVTMALKGADEGQDTGKEVRLFKVR